MHKRLFGLKGPAQVEKVRYSLRKKIRGGDGNRFGNRGHAEKRSNQTGNPKEGPVSEQYF